MQAFFATNEHPQLETQFSAQHCTERTAEWVSDSATFHGAFEPAKYSTFFSADHTAKCAACGRSICPADDKTHRSTQWSSEHSTLANADFSAVEYP